MVETSGPGGSLARDTRDILPLKLEVALVRLALAPRLIVASDYDGTLAPITSHPELARIPARARRALARLAALPGVRVGVISGRALTDLARHIPNRALWLAGSTGLETRTPHRAMRIRVPRARALPRLLRRELREWCTRFPGTWLEVKPHTLAAHYRDLAPRRRAAFAAGVRRRIEPYERTVRLISARRVLEAVPEVGRDKATVLAEWARGMPRHALIWFGDDTHDEPAHAWVLRHGGVAVVVGRRRSVARIRLRSPVGVAEALVQLARWRGILNAGRVARAPARRARATPRRKPRRRA